MKKEVSLHPPEIEINSPLMVTLREWAEEGVARENEVIGKQDTHHSDSCEELLSFKERKHVLMAVRAHKVRVEFPGSKSRGHQENLQPTSTHRQLTANLRERSRKVLSRSYYMSACLGSLQNCHFRSHTDQGISCGWSLSSQAPGLF